MLSPSILHILDHSLPLVSGYSIRSRDIMAAQAQLGWRVAAATGKRHSHAGPAIEAHDSLDYYRLASPELRGSGLGVCQLWAEIRGLARHIEAVARHIRPDILHAHSPALTGVAAAIAAQRLGLPLVYEVRAFWEDAAVANGQTQMASLRYRLSRWLETWVFEQADAVIAICAGLAADICGRGVAAEKVTIVPNAVRSDFCPVPVPVPVPDLDPDLAADLGLTNRDVLAFIGSLYAYEGVADLIAAMPDIVAQHPRAALLIVGDGPEAGQLRRAIAQSPAAAHIQMLGLVSPDSVARLYSLAQLMVYPRQSLRLTELVTPLKPLEAMALGKPVALSAVGGHRDLLGPGQTAFVFPPENPKALAAALLSALQDPALCRARALAGQAHVAAHHIWQTNVHHYHPVYHRLVKH
jgi:PEP-CTERM/exosortase A-associated glycosyltransferase